MSASMTLAEIQAKYSVSHSPEEVAQYQQNMTNGKKWKVAKGEWTWDGLTHMQLRGRALQYHPNLDMMELYSEHPYKTALRLVPKEEYLEDSGDEESEADSDLELDDEAEDEDHDDKVKEAVKQYGLLKKRMEPEGPAKKPAKKVAAVAVDGAPVAKKKAGRPSKKGTTWEQFINMNRVKGAHMTPTKYVTYCQNTVDDDGNQRDATMPVMFKNISDLSPYWMAIEHSSVNDSISWQILPTQDPPFTPDEGEGDLWY